MVEGERLASIQMEIMGCFSAPFLNKSISAATRVCYGRCLFGQIQYARMKQKDGDVMSDKNVACKDMILELQDMTYLNWAVAMPGTPGCFVKVYEEAEGKRGKRDSTGICHKKRLGITYISNVLYRLSGCKQGSSRRESGSDMEQRGRQCTDSTII